MILCISDSKNNICVMFVCPDFFKCTQYCQRNRNRTKFFKRVGAMKSRTVISVIVVIIILFLARSMYSEHNLKKIIGACILAQTQTSGIEEAKQICEDNYK